MTALAHRYWKMTAAPPDPAMPVRPNTVPAPRLQAHAAGRPSGEGQGTHGLGTALIASALLHGAILATGVQVAHEIPDAAPFPAPLTVTLSSMVRDSAPPRTDANSVPAQATATARPAITDKPSQPARFTLDPDLSILETIPVNLPGSITLKLNINAQGKVTQVTVVRSAPAPKALIDGLIHRFSEARLQPALLDQRPIESSLEVTVRFEPGLTPLDN